MLDGVSEERRSVNGHSAIQGERNQTMVPVISAATIEPAAPPRRFAMNEATTAIKLDNRVLRLSVMEFMRSSLRKLLIGASEAA